MFDIGFSELMVIAVVALVVIGPERLPRVARTAGALLGRLQRYVRDVKSDINRELQLEDLKKLQQQMTDQARDLEKSMGSQLNTIESSLNESIAQGLADKPATAADGAPAAGGGAVPAAEGGTVPAVASDPQTTPRS